jgi:hypothetical protein
LTCAWCCLLTKSIIVVVAAAAAEDGNTESSANEVFGWTRRCVSFSSRSTSARLGLGPLLRVLSNSASTQKFMPSSLERTWSQAFQVVASADEDIIAKRSKLIAAAVIAEPVCIVAALPHARADVVAVG